MPQLGQAFENRVEQADAILGLDFQARCGPASSCCQTGLGWAGGRLRKSGRQRTVFLARDQRGKVHLAARSGNLESSASSLSFNSLENQHAAAGLGHKRSVQGNVICRVKICALQNVHAGRAENIPRFDKTGPFPVPMVHTLTTEYPRSG